MTRGVLLTESSFLFLGRSAWRQPPVPVALNHAPFLFQRQPFLLHWLFMPQGGGETGFLVARAASLGFGERGCSAARLRPGLGYGLVGC